MSLQERLLKQKEEIEKKLELFKIYPDLSEYNGRWQKYLQSKFINSLTEGFDIDYSYSCGCCADAVLYAMPYKQHGEFKVYGNPAQVSIGEKNEYGYGEHPWSNWKENLRKYSYSEEIINTVEKYLEQNPPVDYEYEEDEED